MAVAAAAVLLAACAAAAVLLQQPAQGAFVKALYGDMPRTGEGEADVAELITRLKGTNGNTYNYLLRTPEQGMEDLRLMLPALEKEGISVWVTLMPPSGLSAERRADIAYVDYLGWARRLAELSLEHGNLEAWSIDNVMVDHAFFTPGYLEEVTGAAKAVNPRLRFVPVVYRQNVDSPLFDSRAPFFDGVQFYYTHLTEETQDESGMLLPQLDELEGRFGGDVVVGIYASPWAEGRETSTGYVAQVMEIAAERADGIMIYTLYHSAEKEEVIKKHFGGIV
jgi:hypothetical protein